MATIIDLLMALNRGELPALPAPANPMSLGPLRPDGLNIGAPMLPPDAAPPPPLPALDTGLINRTAGAEPTPPAPRGRFERIINAIAGFGAGVAGQGPQFLAQLREPQREYQRQVERFNARRARGVELAEDKQRRQQELTQRRADAVADREFNVWLKKTGVQDQMAIEQMRHAFDIEKQRQAERIADERQAVQEQKQLRLKAADLAKAYRLAGAKELSNELAERDLGLRDKVSAAADKWLSTQVQLQQARLNKVAGGTGTGAGGGNATSLERQFNSLKARFLRAEKPTSSAPRGDRGLQDRISAQILAVMDKLAKLGYEVGFDPSGVYPYIKPPGGQQQPAQAASPQNNDPLGIRQ